MQRRRALTAADKAATWLAMKRAFTEPRGYDPYNSAATRPDVWRTERVTRVRLPPPRRP